MASNTVIFNTYYYCVIFKGKGGRKNFNRKITLAIHKNLKCDYESVIIEFKTKKLLIYGKSELPLVYG